MFIDEVSIQILAGNGGDGAVSFRREKYIPKGGPDGGNGGCGGNVIFEAVTNAHTLANFRMKQKFQADDGQGGTGNLKNGKSGKDLVLKVPVGTQVQEVKKAFFVDLKKPGQKAVVARGGVGGKGNAGFVSSIRQAPNFAEKGDQGEVFEVKLELKLVADVAIVGYPSVGKSTLISVISNAKPKIADYPFTTLVPNLGVAKAGDRELVFVDVPGLIEGASEGKGLGHKFLKHIERASFVLHLIDANSATPLQDFEVIREELKRFSKDLAEKPFLPVFSKIDLTDGELEDFLLDEFEQKFGVRPMKISAATHEGVKEMLEYLALQVPEDETSEDPDEGEEVVLFRPGQDFRGPQNVEIKQIEEGWLLTGERLEQMARQTDFRNAEAIHRIYDVLRKWKVLNRLSEAGAQVGDKLMIGEEVLEFRG